MTKRTAYFREWERKNKERRNAYHRELYARKKRNELFKKNISFFFEPIFEQILRIDCQKYLEEIEE